MCTIRWRLIVGGAWGSKLGGISHEAVCRAHGRHVSLGPVAVSVLQPPNHSYLSHERRSEGPVQAHQTKPWTLMVTECNPASGFDFLTVLPIVGCKSCCAESRYRRRTPFLLSRGDEQLREYRRCISNGFNRHCVPASCRWHRARR